MNGFQTDGGAFSSDDPAVPRLLVPRKLYGRDQETEALGGAFADAGAGNGVVLLVPGRSGSGKTALVHSLRGPVLDKNGFFLEGKFNQYQQDIPLFGLRQALQSLARELLATSLTDRERWRTSMQEAVGQLGRLLTELVPELETLLGPQPPVPDIGPHEAPHRFVSVLRRFLGVLCQAEHPVVLFIDDWQWADAASLAVLTHLHVNTDLRYLLVIASYRDNEVDASHPLTAAVEELHRRGVPLRFLGVHPLASEEVLALLEDTLLPAAENLNGLASFVHASTQGNPFFLRVFLDVLLEGGALWFDRSLWSWRWSSSRAAEEGSTDDVVQLFVRKLRRLPPACADMLSLASCIGNRFDAETLAFVTDKSPEECLVTLHEALKQGLIHTNHQDSPKQPAAGPTELFLFHHDRVQQAAHSLIEPLELAAVRLRIGRLLLVRLTSDQLEERLLEVTDHLNAGRSILADDAERLRLVELNVAAGRKAKAATAYRAALQFHRAAAGLLESPAVVRLFWECSHDLAVQFCTDRAESEFLEGDRAEAERCIQDAVSHAATPLEAAHALCGLIVQYTLLAKYPEAIAAGRQALSGLGISLPEGDFEFARDQEVAAVRGHLNGRTIASLRDAPLMGDPATLMATKLLITMGPPCYRSHPRLWSVIVPKVVGLTLQYGNVPQIGYSHPAFGGLLGWVADDYATAKEFGDLAANLMTDVFCSPSDQSVFYLMMGSSVRHWFEHLAVATDDYTKAWDCGLQSGNLQYAAYAFGHNMYCRFYQGVALPVLLQESKQSLKFSRSRTNQWAIDLLEGGLQVFDALADPSPDSAVPGSFEVAYLDRVGEHHNLQVACIYRILRTFALLVFRRFDEAMAVSDHAEALIGTVGTQGLLPWPEHCFARGLLGAALFSEASAERRETLRGVLDRAREHLRVWAQFGSANYGYKYALLHAETATLDGRSGDAFALYDEAIAGAREGRFTQWEGFANERAARLARSSGQEVLAAAYWQGAYFCYHRWGAAAKVRQLEDDLLNAALAESLRLAPTSGGEATVRARVRLHLESLRAQAVRAQEERPEERARLVQELTLATDHLRAEVAARKRVETDLRESEARFHLMVDTLPVAVVVSRYPHCSLEYVNARAAELFGMSQNDVLGRQTWDFYAEPQDAKPLRDQVEQDRRAESGEVLLRRLNGERFWAIVSATLASDGRGPILLTSIRDVTERKLAQLAHEKLEEQLITSQKMEAVGRLAGGVAHDFNNLLSVILGFTEFALDEAPEGTALREDLLAVKKAGDSAASLTRQLLAFSRRQILQPKPLSLNQIAQGLDNMLRRIVGEDIEFILALEPDLGVCCADPGQIEQVVMNLVVNARDAMPDGGKLIIETANVELEDERTARDFTMKPGSYVMIAVTDTGRGMDEQAKARLFEPFFTTKERGKGTGLGLSTVYGIVRQSGGHIWVYSEVDQGTTFKIYLARDYVLTPLVAKPVVVGRRPVGTETILVAEDAEPLRRVAKRALEDAGYTVLTAEDGNDAMRKLAAYAGDIQLLLTDVVMPGMNGKILAGLVKEARPGIKVLFMSGYTDNALTHDGMLGVGAGFLSKPFTAAALTRKVRDILDGSAAKEPISGPVRMIKDALQALSEHSRSQLLGAVSSLRHDDAVDIIETFRPRDAGLAAALRRMVDARDFEGLRTLLGA